MYLFTIGGQRIDGTPPQGGWGQAGARVVAFNTFGAHLEMGTGLFHLEVRYEVIWIRGVKFRS